MAKSRTKIIFQWQGDLWSVVDQWALEHNYKLKESGETVSKRQRFLGGANDVENQL